MKRALVIVALLLLPFFAHAEVTLLGGVTQFGTPADGAYWNVNQEHEFHLTSPTYGVRWDSPRMWWDTSIGVQYTNFGEARTNALAVNLDAPSPGGYIPNSGGHCIGACAPLSRWVMRSAAQSVALILAKHFNGFSIELGMNVAEVKTSGYVDNPDGTRYNYADAVRTGTSEMYGVAYRHGAWSVRFQIWQLNAPNRMLANGQEEAPAIFNAEKTYSLLAGYSF